MNTLFPVFFFLRGESASSISASTLKWTPVFPIYSFVFVCVCLCVLFCCCFFPPSFLARKILLLRNKVRAPEYCRGKHVKWAERSQSELDGCLAGLEWSALRPLRHTISLSLTHTLSASDWCVLFFSGGTGLRGLARGIDQERSCKISEAAGN